MKRDGDKRLLLRLGRRRTLGDRPWVDGSDDGGESGYSEGVALTSPALARRRSTPTE